MTGQIAGKTLNVRHGRYRRGMTLAVVSSILVHAAALTLLVAPSYKVMRAVFDPARPANEAAAETAKSSAEAAKARSPEKTATATTSQGEQENHQEAETELGQAARETKAHESETDPESVDMERAPAAEPNPEDDPNRAPETITASGAQTASAVEQDRAEQQPRVEQKPVERPEVDRNRLEQQPRVEQMAVEEQKPQPKRRAKGRVPPPSPPPEKDLDEVLSTSARDILGEASEEPPQVIDAPAAMNATIERLYAARLGLFLRHRCAIPETIPQSERPTLSARVLLRLDPRGRLIDAQIIEASANDAFIEALRDTMRSLTFPEPPERIARPIEREGIQVEVTLAP